MKKEQRINEFMGRENRAGFGWLWQYLFKNGWNIALTSMCLIIAAAFYHLHQKNALWYLYDTLGAAGYISLILLAGWLTNVSMGRATLNTWHYTLFHTPVYLSVLMHWWFSHLQPGIGGIVGGMGVSIFTSMLGMPFALFEVPAPYAWGSVAAMLAVGFLLHNSIVLSQTPLPDFCDWIGAGVCMLFLSESAEQEKAPEIKTNKKKESTAPTGLEQALQGYGIAGAKVEQVIESAFVFRYLIRLPVGIKASKIPVADVSRDLRLGEGQHLMLLDNAGDGLVALDAPRKDRQTVAFNVALDSKEWKKAARAMALPMVLGQDVNKKFIVIDLATLPHLLVAGASGGGKSVAVNAMLISLLNACSPEELELVLIDPKLVEFVPYDGLPHLKQGVITDSGDALLAMARTVDEMERRYTLLSAAGVKNIEAYNRQASKADRLPYVVVAFDEYADMINAEMEGLIARLAQKARAAGIHLMLSTQRPTQDVITGIIKTNISARIALKVPAMRDSQNIIDRPGAELLIGYGDMLLTMGAGTKRVFGAYVSDDDVEYQISHIRRLYSA